MLSWPVSSLTGSHGRKEGTVMKVKVKVKKTTELWREFEFGKEHGLVEIREMIEDMLNDGSMSERDFMVKDEWFKGVDVEVLS